MLQAAEELLPLDALAAIFTYLRPTESICCRGVCRKWNNTAGSGTIQIRVKRCSNQQHDIIGSVTLSGRIKKNEINDDTSSSAEQRITSCSAQNVTEFRTRGHLPSPTSQTTQDMNNTIAATFGFVSDRLCDEDCTHALSTGMIASIATKNPCNASIQIEDSIKNPLVSIELGCSKSKFQYGMSQNNQHMICKEKKVRTIRSSIIHLNVSCLQHLKFLSVNGCGSLKSLLLPPSIQSIDAKGCSQLLRIGFPNGCDGTLQNLDLNGCRKLKQYYSNTTYYTINKSKCLFGADTAIVLRIVRHLDLSQLQKEGTLDKDFCLGLSSTVSLETFSMRYCASDAIIMALAESESTCGGKLRLVDIAFSTKVTDVAVKMLVRNASALERINMRGCKGISGECYNNIPVYLERRRRGETVDEVLEIDESFPSSRKGDNLFYFCRR